MTSPRPPRLQRFPLFALLAFLLSGFVAFATPVRFDIPAQPAPAALKLFNQQSGKPAIFIYDDLKGIQANEVTGELEPAAALEQLLRGTGFEITKTTEKNFVVGKSAPAKPTTGSVRGTLLKGLGVPSDDIRVIVRETGQQARTDKDGEFFLSSIEPGTYLLIATADGFQPLHITDVVVKAGYEVSLSREELHSASGTVALDPYVVHAETVERLEKFEVTGEKPKPFTTANVDIPRTIDDVQPYYILDARTISQSGATNVEDLLKNRLTMNTTAMTNAQFAPGNGSPRGTTSTINLRGLGATETLILVNGRRMAGVSYGDSDQPDLNGIPLSAIDRIEVLPSSASGIYGGSAIGGVVNVILKKDYSGGEIRATYENTTGTDAPIRTASVTWGQALDHGKMHLMITAQNSDAQPLLFQDRRQLFDRGYARISKNAPNTFYGRYNPFLGATPNIYSDSGQNLILQSGTPLNSLSTSIPAGTSGNTSSTDLYAGLLSHAGQYNFNLPQSTQSPTGLLRPLGSTPRTNSLMASLDRSVGTAVEVFAEFSHNENHARSVNNPFGYFFIPANAPTNPFTSDVDIKLPSALAPAFNSDSQTTSVTAGAIAKLPYGWTAELDYTWSKSKFSYLYYGRDYRALTADVSSGALNPFVDTLAYPLSLEKYLTSNSDNLASTLNDVALRGAGPILYLPWGSPTLVTGLEQRTSATPANIYAITYPISSASNFVQTDFPRKQVTRSLYAEGTVPLVKNDVLPFIHSLDFQFSGRSEQYTVDAGTPGYYSYPSTGVTNYIDPTLNGQPYFARTSYTSVNFTQGLKYQPTKEIILRVSHATAFLPPSPDQLVKNPQPDSNPSTIVDPKTGAVYDVQTISGGNPGLKPQSSDSWNAGVIWQPVSKTLSGLRADFEWYRITQHSAIGSLGAQDIVTAESVYPTRVTRDVSGRVTLVDTSLVNLFKYETQGLDLNIDYRRATPLGTWTLHAAGTYILEEKRQGSVSAPLLDYASYVASGGPDKLKGNATLTWERNNWSVAWTTRYFSSYHEQGAPGDPNQSTYWLTRQGSPTIPSQTYHDIFAGYTFGKATLKRNSMEDRIGAALTDGLTLQVGIKNVFDTLPPFDAYYSPYYTSAFGDIRLRSYWISVKKAF